MMSNPADVSVNSPAVPTPDLTLASLRPGRETVGDPAVTSQPAGRNSAPPMASATPSSGEQRPSSAPPAASSDYSAWTVGSTESLAAKAAGAASVTPSPLSPYKSDGTVASTQSLSPPPPATLHSQTVSMRPPPPGPPGSLAALYQTRLLSTPAPCVESLLASSCEALNFDIAEMWLRTGPKTHQLTNSHVRPTALDESVRKQLVDVYYGERSAERTHRLSPALCKRAKEAGDVVWVAAHTARGAEALKCSISDVRTAVAVPVCHGSGVNVTIIYFSIRRAVMKPQAVEFLVHMSLSTATAAVNALAEEVMVDEMPQVHSNASSVQSQEEKHLVSRPEVGWTLLTYPLRTYLRTTVLDTSLDSPPMYTHSSGNQTQQIGSHRRT